MSDRFKMSGDLVTAGGHVAAYGGKCYVRDLDKRDCSILRDTLQTALVSLTAYEHALAYDYDEHANAHDEATIEIVDGHRSDVLKGAVSFATYAAGKGAA